jgi:hypothetical protein
MILKGAIMSQINEAIVGSELEYKICITISILFCSGVSFIAVIISRKWHHLFMLSLLISNLTFVFLLLSLLASAVPDIRKIFFPFPE